MTMTDDRPAIDERPAQSGTRGGPPVPAATAARRDRWPDLLHVVPWRDPIIDRLGHDPRSAYVETFWLGVLGPSATWLLRRLAGWLEATPDGLTVDLDELAAALGLGGRSGRHVPLLRALDRLVSFGMARTMPSGPELAVRRSLPPLAQRHLQRLPSTLRRQHDQWLTKHRRDQDQQVQARARQLALSLVRLGEDEPAIAAQLARWRVHPAVAHEAVRWATAHGAATCEAPHPDRRAVRQTDADSKV
jgi:hypothetical protein